MKPHYRIPLRDLRGKPQKLEAHVVEISMTAPLEDFVGLDLTGELAERLLMRLRVFGEYNDAFACEVVCNKGTYHINGLSGPFNFGGILAWSLHLPVVEGSINGGYEYVQAPVYAVKLLELHG